MEGDARTIATRQGKAGKRLADRVLSIEPDHATGEIARGIGAGRFGDQDAVDDLAWDEVEAEGARIHLGAGGNGIVDEGLVVALRQPADDDKARILDGDARHPLHHLGSIAVYAAGNLLC